jgi:hypothetical protein
MTEFVYDHTGRFLAQIDDGNLYRATDGHQVGVVREFVVYDLSGRRLAHVDQFSEFHKQPLPSELVNILVAAVFPEAGSVQHTLADQQK